MTRYLLILLALVTLFSCSGKKTPNGVLEPDKMQEVLWDYIRADIFTADYISVDSSKKLPAENVKLQKAIFAKYKISKEDFYKSYTFYEQHPMMMQTMLDSLIAKKRRIVDSSHIKTQMHPAPTNLLPIRRDSAVNRFHRLDSMKTLKKLRHKTNLNAKML
jgi:hypothetical protein